MYDSYECYVCVHVQINKSRVVWGMFPNEIYKIRCLEVVSMAILEIDFSDGS